ncbi:MAG: hypothetical protein KC503_31545 [Myxococcales bacterium]|nr:hypothetical protein [Myxococcales bacterium]
MLRRALWVASVIVVGASSSGCSSTPKVSGERLVIFPPRVRARLSRRDARALYDHATQLLSTRGSYKVVDARAVQKTMRRRGRCTSFKCQAREAPKRFGAGSSVALSLTREGSSCRVGAELYDLPRRVMLANVFKRSQCKVDALREALDYVMCRLAEVPPEPEDKKMAAKPAAREIGSKRDKRRKKKTKKRRRRRVRKKHKKLKRAKPQEITDGSTPGCIAAGSYLWADREFEAFGKQAFRGRPARAEQRSAERLLALKSLYDGYASSPVKAVQVAALCRQGMLYDVYADRLAKGEIGRWRPSAYKQGRPSLEQRAASFRKHGARYYQRCVQRARDLGVTHPFVTHAKARLSALGQPAAPTK